MPPREERIDYDSDPIKHYVRYDGWLEAFRYQHDRVSVAIRVKRRKQPFTYFTFCASQAIDVFMLEREGLLVRDEAGGRLNHVYFCERREDEFAQIVNLIKSEQAGFKGDFKEIILFEDDDDTHGKDAVDMVGRTPDKAVRDKFRYKELHRRFHNLFPLDVINLDVHGVFFPQHENKYSAMLRAVKKIFEWQQHSLSVEDNHRCERFTLMLTSHLEEGFLKEGALGEMEEIVQDNITNHEEFSEAFNAKFGHTNPGALRVADFPTFFAVTLPKLIAPLAREHGWFGEHRRIYTYARSTHAERPPYYMMSSIVNYERLPAEADRLPRLWDNLADEFVTRYVREMCDVLTYKPVDVIAQLELPGIRPNVTQDLQSIVNFRESFLTANMQ